MYICPSCGCAKDNETFEQPGTCPACEMALIEKTGELDSLTKIPAFLKLTDQVWTGGQPTLEHLA